MDAATPPATPPTLQRFDRTERALHWATAALFLVLMLTAVPLYMGSVAAFIGRRDLLARIHVWCGVALPIPLVLSVLGRWGDGLRRDIRRFSRWSAAEVDWLRSFGRGGLPQLDKFNPGQKLNAVFVAGTIVVMLGTGSIMRWFGPFPDSWRTGATFVHDLLATAVFVVVIGHIGFALAHRESLRSIFTGRIGRDWAGRHAPGWLDEQDGRAGPGGAAVQMPRGSRAGSQSSSVTAARKA